MANEEQLSILKQGVDVWNKWRKENVHAEIDLREGHLIKAGLRGCNLRKADLRGADLREANLAYADLRRATLTNVDFRKANLNAANLDGASLGGANLWNANLSVADLRKANLKAAVLDRANLSEANLSEADLSEASLNEAYLGRANLRGASLIMTRFSSASLGSTEFGSLDLSEALGLEDVRHYAPSTIGTNTIARSKGKIPEIFLRGCGLSDWEIEVAKLYNPELSNGGINNIQYRMYDLRAGKAFQIAHLFISYSHSDGKFVDKVGDCLTQKGIR